MAHDFAQNGRLPDQTLHPFQEVIEQFQQI